MCISLIQMHSMEAVSHSEISLDFAPSSSALSVCTGLAFRAEWNATKNQLPKGCQGPTFRDKLA